MVTLALGADAWNEGQHEDVYGGKFHLEVVTFQSFVYTFNYQWRHTYLVTDMYVWLQVILEKDGSKQDKIIVV